MIRVFAARTVRWRGIFAVHAWIVVKEKANANYSRYDYTAWGEPIRTNGFAPTVDGLGQRRRPWWPSTASVPGAHSENSQCDRELQIPLLRRLRRLAWSQLEHVRSSRS